MFTVELKTRCFHTFTRDHLNRATELRHSALYGAGTPHTNLYAQGDKGMGAVSTASGAGRPQGRRRRSATREIAPPARI